MARISLSLILASLRTFTWGSKILKDNPNQGLNGKLSFGYICLHFLNIKQILLNLNKNNQLQPF